MIRRRFRGTGSGDARDGRGVARRGSHVAAPDQPPARWRRLIDSGLFDGEFYAARTGEPVDKPMRLAKHAVRTGMPSLTPVHPLIDPRWLPAQIQEAWRTGDIDKVVALLGSQVGGDAAWSPLFDPRVLGARRGDPSEAGSRALAFLEELADVDVLPRVTSGDPRDVTWAAAREALAESARWVRTAERYVDPTSGAVRWENVDSDASHRVAGRVSVVTPTFQDVVMTRDAVGALLEQRGPNDDLEIIVVDNGSDAEISLALESDLFALPGVRVLRLDTNANFAGGSNAGLAVSTGELVLFLNNDTAVRPGWLDPLRARLASPDVRGVQPLLLYPDDTIQAAGTVFLARDSLATHLIAGHPRADAAQVGRLRFSAITAAAMLVHAREVIALRGFDTSFANGMEDVDLCLRAIEASGGYFAVEPTAVVEHREGKSPGRNAKIPENRRLFLERWRGRLPAEQSALYGELGFHVAHLGVGAGAHPAPRAHVIRPPRDARTEGGSIVPALRWSIKSPAAPGPAGDRTEETAVVHRLSAELASLGQEVVEFRAGTHRVPATALDDVSVVIRGEERAWSHPGKINVLWLVADGARPTPAEVSEFDLLVLDSPEESAHLAAPSGASVNVVPPDGRRVFEEVLAISRRGPALDPVWRTKESVDAPAVPAKLGRACVYSCLFGGYEELNPQPAFAGDRVDKILFTDDPTLRSDDWEVRVVAPALPADPGRSVRRLKILAHEALPEHTTSLYIDNTVQLKVPPSQLIEELLPASARWACVQHSYRGSVEEEAEVIATMRQFDAPERVREQIDHYRNVSPESLSAQTLWGGMLARRHSDPLVREVQTIWWEQVLRYSRRDQLSLPYALLAARLVPEVHRFDIRESDHHRWPVVVGRDPLRALGPRVQ